MSMRKVKVVIKPVFFNFEAKVLFARSQSVEIVKEMADGIIRGLRQNLTSDAELLEPSILEKDEDVVEIGRNSAHADLFLIFPMNQYGVRLEELNKPIVFFPTHRPGSTTLGIASRLGSLGKEKYTPLDYQEFNELIHLLKVKKSLCITKALLFTSSSTLSENLFDAGWNFSSVYDLEEIKRRIGVTVEPVLTVRLLERMEQISQEDVERDADEFIRGAKDVDVKSEDVIRSVRLYLTLKEFLSERRASAVTVSCGESFFYENRITPCIAFSLLNDEGIPSACEADLGLLSAIMVLMYLSDKSVFMGNLHFSDLEKNLIRVNHDVGQRKLEGLEGPSLPYSLYEYHTCGYGTTIYTEMRKGQVVTLARFNSDHSEMSIAKGIITCCYVKERCRVAVEVELSDARKFFSIALDSAGGPHWAVVYGDYINKLKKLGEILGIEVKAST